MTRWLLEIVVLAVVFGGILGGRAWLDRQRAAEAAAQAYPAAMVTTATAQQAQWDNTQRVIAPCVPWTAPTSRRRWPAT